MQRLNIAISDDLSTKLDRIAEQGQQTKSEVFRKAFTLLDVAWAGKQEGKKLALVDKDGKVTTEIVGL